ncbi:MAG: lamin tail domain-containing protein [PVC group bacterium]
MACINSFWDIETSGQTWSIYGTGKTTAEMMTKSTFSDADWDFDFIWDNIEGESCPYFKLEYPKVTINEIMYDPAIWQGSDYYNEYVELYNYGSEPVDASRLLIGDWADNDKLYAYEDGGTTIIPPGGYALITDTVTEVYETFYVDPNAIRLRVEDNAIGQGLNNSGDIVLLSLNGVPVERLIYNDTIEWHKYDAAGYGASLQRINPMAPAQDPCNWCGDGLSPGRGSLCTIISEINIDPDTLNLKSKGRWITCYIELPDYYTVDEIDIATVALTAISGDIVDPSIYVEGPSGVGDYDGDGVPDLMVKFNRSQIQVLLEVSEETLTVTGDLIDGTPFEGNDIIKILK